MAKTGRNDPCPCGSGKKYKHCCIHLKEVLQPASESDVDDNRTWIASSGQGLLTTPGAHSSDALFEDNDYEDHLDDLSDQSPFEIERTFWNLQRLLSSGLIPEGEDPDAVLNDWMDQNTVPEVPYASPLEEAQDIMYDAWLTDDLDEQRALALQALELSPDCADAYLFMADLKSRSDDDALQWCFRAVEAGERALGLAYPDPDPPDLTGKISAYPYFRATLMLAFKLIDVGRGDEAVERLEYLSQLDRLDAQGARLVLMIEYLRQKRPSEAEALVARYPDNDSISWLYANSLLAFQIEGNSRKARRLLKGAVTENPYFAGALTNFSLEVYGAPHPLELDYQLKRDAFYGAREQAAAWESTEGAVSWLMHYLHRRKHDLPVEVRELSLSHRSDGDQDPDSSH